MYIIGVDIGTGSTKAVAVSTSGQVLETSQVSYPIIQPQPTFSEQAPELIWQSFAKCIGRISTTLGSPAGIVFSSAMHSVIPVDSNGMALMNMITWADNRSADIAAKIKMSADGEMLYRQTGTPIHAMSPLCKIYWLKETEPSLFASTFKFISIKEYIWYRLTGHFEVDHSIASATGLFNILEHRWNAPSLELAGITEEHLSTPVSTQFIRKKINQKEASLLNIDRETPLIIGASDGCLANLGSFAIEPGKAALTIGTSGAIRVASSKPVYNFNAMTFNYCLFDNLFISGGPINNGGVALKWYAENFLKTPLVTANDYEALLGAIEKTEAGAQGLIFLPYLLGERAPIWNSDSSASFFGIRNYHTQAHFTRAVVEGISMALYGIMRAMEDSGLTIDQVNVSGGFVHSTIWLQILADIFNKPIFLIHDEDASALGGAFLGLKTMGLITDYNKLHSEETISFQPDQSRHKTYEKLFGVYQRLYVKTSDEMEILSDLKN